MEAENEDHRVRVAKARRARMIHRLLQAVMECYAGHVQNGPPTVDEVIDRAGVSRATFYKYFNSIDEAIEQRASELVDEMVESLKELVQPGMRPILMLTISVHLFLLRSVMDRTWGAFVARSDLMRTDGVLFQGMTAHLAASLVEGDATYSDAESARTLAIGAMREAMRLIAQADAPRRAFVDEVTTIILVGLGIARQAAALLVKDATIFIRGAAPDRLNWWRDPWIGLAGTA